MAKKITPKKPVKVQPTDPAPPYNAAGLTHRGVLDIVTGEEYKRRGFTDYPWSTEVKAGMVEACNGLKTGADIVAKIKEMSPHAA